MKEKLIEIIKKVIESTNTPQVVNVSNSFYSEMKGYFIESHEDRQINLCFEQEDKSLGGPFHTSFMNNDFIEDGTIGVCVSGEDKLKIIHI
jgi:hypothetical protein